MFVKRILLLDDKKEIGNIFRLKYSYSGDIYFHNKKHLYVLKKKSSIEKLKNDFPIESYCISPYGQIYYSTYSNINNFTFPETTNRQIYQLNQYSEDKLIAGPNSINIKKELVKEYYLGKQINAVFGEILDMYIFDDYLLILENKVLRKVIIENGITETLTSNLKDYPLHMCIYKNKIFLLSHSKITCLSLKGYILYGMEGKYNLTEKSIHLKQDIEIVNSKNLVLAENNVFSEYNDDLDCVKPECFYDRILGKHFINKTIINDEIVGNYITSLAYDLNNNVIFSTDNGIYTIN